MAGPATTGAAELSRLWRGRLACVLFLAMLATMAVAADSIRVFTFPDGRIRLWLKGAPTVTASPQGGWRIEPEGKEKDKTWLKRLRGALGASEGSPWKTLLESIKAGSPVEGVETLKPKATLNVEPTPEGLLKVRTADGKGATFKNSGGTWASPDAAGLDAGLSSSLGVSPASLETSMLRSTGEAGEKPSAARAWATYLAKSASGTLPPILLDTPNGPAVVAAELESPSSSGTSGSTSAPHTDEPKPTEPQATSGFSWGISVLFLLLGGGIGAGAGLYLAARRAADQTAELEALRTSSKELNGRLKKREEELARTKKTLDETKRAAHEYQSQQSAWSRDRDETLRALNEARIAQQTATKRSEVISTQLRQAQDEQQRVARELGQQIESLNRSGQKSQGEAAALSAKARSFSELQVELAEAFNYIQGEIGRAETSAAVGYLLNYSCGELLQTIPTTNPTLARAMLSNIERIASAFPTVPHARKLAATAQRLAGELGQGSIPESAQPHAHARHFDEMLRLLRHQRGLELSPFYFAADGTGAVHAVHV